MTMRKTAAMIQKAVRGGTCRPAGVGAGAVVVVVDMPPVFDPASIASNAKIRSY
jgi:hypothetical protein